MAFFYIYLDESGKLSGNSDYTSLCGYVSSAQEWQRFGLEWNACRLKWGVPAIHMAQIMSPNPRGVGWNRKQDEWGSQWQAKRDTMLAEFGHTIRVSSLVCIGSVVDANAFREILKDPTCVMPHGDSNVFAFQHAITKALKKIEVVDECNPVSIVLDDDRNTAQAYYSVLDSLRNDPSKRFEKIRERIHGICFGNDISYPGLQAADMLAYVSRDLMRLRKADPTVESPELFVRLTNFGTHQPQFYTSELLYKIARETAEKSNRTNDENIGGPGV